MSAPLPRLPAPGSLGAWLLAARPRTLPVGAAPVGLGVAAAYGAGRVDALASGAALLGALAIQVGTNLANDLADGLRGTDGPDRVGPPRALASGLLGARALRTGIAVSFLLASAAGVILAWKGGLAIIAIGVASLVLGIAYTAGPFPLAYKGAADPVAFAFFGPVAVGGTFLAHGGDAPPGTLLAAGAALGSLAAAVLTVNNIRDIEGDARAGKRTLPVRLGREGALTYLAALLLLPYAIAIGIAISRQAPLALLPLLLAPASLRLHRRVREGRGPALSDALAACARLLLGTALLLAPALALGPPGGRP